MVTVRQLKSIALYAFFFPFAMLGVDTKVLCMLGKHATTDLHPKPDLCKCSEHVYAM